jgi:phage gpG-like protein
MPSVQISVDTTLGKAKITRLLKAVEPSTVLDAIGARLLHYVNESFETRGRGTWAALAPITLMLRKRGGDAPLQDTGRLKGSYVSEQGGPGTDYQTDNATFVEVGSNVKTPDGTHSLAKIHEYGAVVEPKPGTFWQYSYTTSGKRGGRTVNVTRAAMLVLGKIGDRLIFARRVVIPARPVMPSQETAERMVRETIDGMLSRISAPGGGRFGGG